MMAAACSLLVAYFALGALFAVWFCWRGARRIDPHADRVSWGFRVLIFPGSTALWPLLLHRVWRKDSHPPIERTLHRIASGEVPASR